MVKVIAALLDKPGKQIFNEGLIIEPLKNISKVLGFRLYHLNKKGAKSKRENLVKW